MWSTIVVPFSRSASRYGSGSLRKLPTVEMSHYSTSAIIDAQ